MGAFLGYEVVSGSVGSGAGLGWGDVKPLNVNLTTCALAVGSADAGVGIRGEVMSVVARVRARVDVLLGKGAKRARD